MFSSTPHIITVMSAMLFLVSVWPFWLFFLFYYSFLPSFGLVEKYFSVFSFTFSFDFLAFLNLFVYVFKPMLKDSSMHP